MSGVIYLVHFDAPLHHARHYLGWCHSYEGVDSRLEYHASGQGSKILKAVGRKFQLVRLWKGSRDDERRLKNRKEGPALCPVCSVGKQRPVRGLEEIKL